MLFPHGLRSVLWIDAGRSQKLQLLHAIPVRCVYHVGLDREIIIYEVRGESAVGADSTDFGGRQKYVLRAFIGKEAPNCVLLPKVELFTAAQDEIVIARRPQAA